VRREASFSTLPTNRKFIAGLLPSANKFVSFAQHREMGIHPPGMSIFRKLAHIAALGNLGGAAMPSQEILEPDRCRNDSLSLF
jgi:hypothetical protein